MGNQQNPDGIYIPPGNTSRYPLNYNQHDYRCTCWKKTGYKKGTIGWIRVEEPIYNPECMIHGQTGIS